LSECRVAAITRPGSDLSDFYSLPIDRAAGQIELVIADTPIISSAEIRRCVFEGRAVEGVCPPVEEFIRSNGLYR
jgi:nicotinic acid mononucleotide adenylyltransferase